MSVWYNEHTDELVLGDYWLRPGYWDENCELYFPVYIGEFD